MANYYNIQLSEMIRFLEGQARPFQRIDLKDGTMEVVFARRYDRRCSDGVIIPLSLRVYTGIELGGQSRQVGKDAIRVCVVARWSNRDYGIGSAKRCNRVEGWRENLQQRIDSWEELAMPYCPVCSAPMIFHKPKPYGRKFTPFWGCMRYSGDPNNTCTGTLKAD
jgi:hypothetical protein